MTRVAFAILIALLSLPVLFARTGLAADWQEIGAVESLEVLTTDEDGEARETLIWVLELDGVGYIRTGGSTWGDNVERDPKIALRVGETVVPVRAEFVEDDAERERITTAFREKYGWVDGALDIFRGREPRIMLVEPR